MCFEEMWCLKLSDSSSGAAVILAPHFHPHHLSSVSLSWRVAVVFAPKMKESAAETGFDPILQILRWL